MDIYQGENLIFHNNLKIKTHAKDIHMPNVGDSVS